MTTIEEMKQKLLNEGFEEVFEGKLVSDGKDLIINNMVLYNVVKIYFTDEAVFFHTLDRNNSNDITEIAKIIRNANISTIFYFDILKR